MSTSGCSKIEKVQDYIDKKGCVKMAYTQTLEVGELDIVSFCNLNCYSCNRFMDVFPVKDMMTVEQVKFFVDESIELDWPWRELRIMGGEPSIHPQFKEILDEMMRLKRFKTSILIKVITNGTGKKVQERLKLVPPEFPVMNSMERYDTTHMELNSTTKKHVIPDFGNMWQAPIDRLPQKPSSTVEGFIPSTKIKEFDENTVYSCQVHQTCGLGISHNGILPCGCGNAIGRVVGLDFYFKSLKEVTIEECHKRLEILCGLCGRNLNYTIPVRDNMEQSPFWEEAFEEYRKEVPKLPLYGVTTNES